MVQTMTARAPQKLGYQPSLDGVRAISVIAVILYHAKLGWIPGGFLGVEVFFVVSGFLITALLIEERHHTGTVSLRNFWARRARRLLPALFVLLLVVPAVMLIFYRDAAGRLGGDVIAALFYVSNWWQIFLNESYFEAAGRPPVLRHLWSLAVEEQFYIIFPAIFVFLMAKGGRNRTRNVLVVAAIGSAIWMAVLYDPANVSRVYYGTDTRLSGMLLGAVLALMWTPWRSRATPSKAAGPALDVIGVLALVGLAWFFLRVNDFDPFVYERGFLLLDVLCIVLIAVLVHPSSRLSKMLSWAPLVWIGKRSYSIYLWHWPIFMVTRPGQDISLDGLPLFLLRTTLTLAAAELSYRYVEQPVRHGAIGAFMQRLRESDGEERARLQQTLFIRGGTLGAIVLLVVVGMFGAATSPDRERLELAEAGVVNVDGSQVADVASAEVPTTPEVPSATVDGETATTTTAPNPDTTVASEIVPTNALAVGDSVMLGARGTMERIMPGIRVDAEVARQFDDLADAASWYATSGNMPGPAVVQIGNNGVPQADKIEEMIENLGDRKVILVNAHVDRSWEGVSNARTAAAAERHDNVELVDWKSMAEDHPEWFAKDGTHLRPAGQVALAEAISEHL